MRLATVRSVHRLEEQMMRAMMPRTNAADPTPLPAFAAPSTTEIRARHRDSRLVRPVPALTFTLAEVAHAR